MKTDNIKNFRLGDSVYWMDGGVRFEGVIEKINRKSVKARQTNDVDRRTQAAFGYSGRTKGGKGRLWTLGVSDSGTTCFLHTYDQATKLEDTARGASMRRAKKREALNEAYSALKYAVECGAEGPDLRDLIERVWGE